MTYGLFSFLLDYLGQMYLLSKHTVEFINGNYTSVRHSISISSHGISDGCDVGDV